MARAAADRDCFTQHGARERSRCFAWLRVEGRAQQRIQQALIDGPVARHEIADRAIAFPPQQSGHRKILYWGRCGHPRRAVKDPVREPSIVDADRPALVGRDIDHRKGRARRTAQPLAGSDRRDEVHGRAIAGEDQVIAVVDHHAERRVVIAPAAPSGMVSSLMQRDREAAVAEANGGGEAGKSGAYDVYGARHQAIAWRSSIQSSSALGMRTGARGEPKPRATSRERIALYTAPMSRGARTARAGQRAMMSSALVKCARARSTIAWQAHSMRGSASTLIGSVFEMPASRNASAGR